ncbi:MAG: hypothetical protein KBD01_20385 [Acidobacteria bacterium]|nr:hypothetical protein [Acidobacteriota bacterium]
MPTQLPDEVLAVAALLARAADGPTAQRVLGAQARRRFGAAAMAVLRRDRRSGEWTIVARAGGRLAANDAALFTDPASRDPSGSVRRLARPFRPHGRLSGGVVIYRDDPPFSRREGNRLGRLTRVMTADLLRRERELWQRAELRLHRKLAAGVRPIDVLYHLLDAAAEFTAADHSVTVLAGPPGARCVLAEKLGGGARSARIGELAGPEAVHPGLAPPAHVLQHALPAPAGRRGGALLVIRAVSGDPFDDGDRTALASLAPLAGLLTAAATVGR